MMIFSDPLNLLFLAIAAIAGFKLWQVLGKRSGAERPLAVTDFKTVTLPTDLELKAAAPPPQRNTWQGHAVEGSELAKNLDILAASDLQFDSNQFLSWAKTAHEAVLNAFASGDTNVLNPLLSSHTMALFEKEITRRKAEGELAIFKFVSIKAALIKQVTVADNQAQIEVAFISSVYSAIKNTAGAVISGNDKRAAEVKELWTFERNLKNPSETWHLSETNDLPDHA